MYNVLNDNGKRLRSLEQSEATSATYFIKLSESKAELWWRREREFWTLWKVCLKEEIVIIIY